MSPTTIRIQTQREIRCPLCQQTLTSSVITTILGFAFCEPCGTYNNRGLARSTIGAYLALADRSDWSTSHGLHFYTPQPFHPRDKAFYLESPELNPFGNPIDQLVEADRLIWET